MKIDMNECMKNLYMSNYWIKVRFDCSSFVKIETKSKGKTTKGQEKERKSFKKN